MDLNFKFPPEFIFLYLLLTVLVSIIAGAGFFSLIRTFYRGSLKISFTIASSAALAVGVLAFYSGLPLDILGFYHSHFTVEGRRLSKEIKEIEALEETKKQEAARLFKGQGAQILSLKDYPEDTDNNGAYDHLTLEVILSVPRDYNYGLGGKLSAFPYDGKRSSLEEYIEGVPDKLLIDDQDVAPDIKAYRKVYLTTGTHAVKFQYTTDWWTDIDYIFKNYSGSYKFCFYLGTEAGSILASRSTSDDNCVMTRDYSHQEFEMTDPLD